MAIKNVTRPHGLSVGSRVGMKARGGSSSATLKTILPIMVSGLVAENNSTMTDFQETWDNLADSKNNHVVPKVEQSEETFEIVVNASPGKKLMQSWTDNHEAIDSEDAESVCSDYHGSDDGDLDRENPFKARRRQLIRVKSFASGRVSQSGASSGRAKAFINTLLHAMECRYCDDTACKKMRLVLGHFLTCGKLKASNPCQLCNQLIDIVTLHAHTDCEQRGTKNKCPVPMCDIIRQDEGGDKISGFPSEASELMV